MGHMWLARDLVSPFVFRSFISRHGTSIELVVLNFSIRPAKGNMVGAKHASPSL